MSKRKVCLVDREKKDARFESHRDKLLKSGMSFRNISRVAGYSHGSVSAEKKEMLRDEELAKQKMIAEQNAKDSASALLFPDQRPTEAA